jgi:glycosyltransferase involved in cell wall biosynthesis
MTEGLRIAFLTPRFHPQAGGAETYTRELLKALVAKGHSVDVVAGADPNLPTSHEVGGVHVHRPGPSREESTARRVRWFPGFVRAATRTLHDLRPDVVFAQYTALAPAARYSRRAGVAFVALAHDQYRWGEHLRMRGPVAGSLRYLGNERLLAGSHPDAVVTVSNAMADAVRVHVRAPIFVAGAGVDHVPEGPEPDPASKRILFVGRLVRSKGAPDAARAVAEVRRRVPDAELVVVGKGSDAKRLPSSVRVIPYLEEDALDREMRGAAVLVLPSVMEGWGLVLCEAAARYLPYVAYDIPAVREQHELLQGGLLVPPRDVPALSRGLEDLLTDPERRRRLGHQGHDAARARLSWSSAASVVEEALLGSVRRKRRVTNLPGPPESER